VAKDRPVTEERTMSLIEHSLCKFDIPSVDFSSATGAGEDLGWLRKCNHQAGASISEAGDDRVCAIKESFSESAW
jgi:hypothetical protein